MVFKLSRLSRCKAVSQGFSPLRNQREKGRLDFPSRQTSRQSSRDQRHRYLRFSDIFPLDHFSNSIYSVPILLLFRFFYHASVSETASPQPVRVYSSSVRSSSVFITSSNKVTLFDRPQWLEPTEFWSTINESEALQQNYQVSSMTWVKALASPLSHEYIQVIVENKRTKIRHRIAIDRSDSGDVVIVGWDWSSSRYPSHHFILPLPLLTLSFEQQKCGPSLPDLASIVANISDQRQYNLLREMCWWYAEKIFMTTSQRFPDGSIHTWPHAHLRYSFVLRTQWIKRGILAKQAEAFRVMNMQDLRY